MTAPLKPHLRNPHAWDATRLRDAMSCRRRFLLGHVFGLQRRGTLELDLEFGKAMHAGFEAWDKARVGGSGRNATERALKAALQAAWKASERFPKAGEAGFDTKKNRRTLLRVFPWYAEQFAEDVLDTVRLTDGRAAVEQAHSIPILGGRALLVSRPDGLVQFEPFAVYIRERKSSGSAPGPYYDARWNPDIQITIQALVGRTLLADRRYRFNGVLLESVHLYVDSVRFSRVPCERPTELLDEAQAEIEAEVAALQALLARVKLESTLTELEPAFPRNESACALCRFKQICSAPRSDRSRVIAGGFEQRPEPWDPLHA